MTKKVFLAEIKTLSRKHKNFKSDENEKWIREKIREVARRGETSITVRWGNYGLRFPYEIVSKSDQEKMKTYLISEGFLVQLPLDEIKISW